MSTLLESGVTLLERHHLDKHSLWRDDQDKNLYFPVRTPNDMPDNPGDLLIKANFITPIKINFSGYIKGINKGIDKLLYINIFYNGQSYGFNYNLPSLCHVHLNELIEALPEGSANSKDDLFPLRYETCFDWENYEYSNFWGSFDAFIKERKAKP